MVGERIKGFVLVERLGQGGMGEVWSAEQPIVKTKVAIKLLIAGVSQDQAQVDRFFGEAVAVDKIKHAGIVRIFDVGYHDGRAFLIMELLEGESLRARLARLRRLPLGALAVIGRQIAGVLAATHTEGITHRDLKPDNIFLARDVELPAGERVKLLDFGIAKLGTVNATATGGTLGTPAYMAPELWRDAASADKRVDLYALGCLLFEMCTGRVPFITQSIGEACSKHLYEQPPSLAAHAPNAPATFRALVARMLEKDPEQRPTLPEISAELAALAAVSASGLEETLPESSGKLVATTVADTTLGAAAGAITPKRRSRAPWVLAGLGAVAVAGGIAVIASQSSPDERPAPLRVPKLGLSAIEVYRDPTSASSSRLRSADFWAAARDDFADACQQPAAELRWCAAGDFATAELAMIEGHVDAASPAFLAAIAKDHDWAVPHVGFANALATGGNVRDALAEVLIAERLDPTWWQAPATGGRTWAAQSAYPQAISEYRRALELAPKNAMLMGELALLYHATAMDTEADRMSEAAVALDPDLVAIRLLRGERALEARDGTQALAEAERILGVSPDAGAAHLLRGDALALLGDKAGAFAEYKLAAAVLAPYNTSAPEARLHLVLEAMKQDRLPPPREKPEPDKPTTRSKPGCQKGRSCVLPGGLIDIP